MTEPIAGNRGLMGSGGRTEVRNEPRNHSEESGRPSRDVIGRFAVARGGYLRSDTRADIVGRTPMTIVSKRCGMAGYSTRLSAPFVGTALADTGRTARWSRGRQSGNLSKETLTRRRTG